MSNISKSCQQNGNIDGKSVFQNTTAFREMERRYKWSRAPVRTRKGKELRVLQQNHDEVDLRDVVDIRNLSNNNDENRALLRKIDLSTTAGSHKSIDDDNAILSSPTLDCFAFDAVPGLYLFPSCISEAGQAQLCREAILDYGNSSKYRNSMSTHVKEPQETRCYEPPMRWATIGFNYEWSTKSYHGDNYAPFPSLVRNTMESLAAYVFLAESLDEKMPPHEKVSQPSIYQPQSGIVNYFPVGTTMMSHQDAAEEALTQPLLSLSLGCPCIFLMGTQSTADPPFAFLLRSGDLAAFAGPARLCFHSVPRILDDCPSYLTVSNTTPEEEQCYKNFCYDLKKSVASDIQEETEAKSDLPNSSLCPSPEKRKKLEPSTEGFTVDPSIMSEEEKERYWRLAMKHMRINLNARQVYRESCNFLFA